MEGSSKKGKKIVHKVDGTSKKDENLIKSIKWTVHQRMMKNLSSS